MSIANHIRLYLLAAVTVLCLWLPSEAHAVSGLPSIIDGPNGCATLGGAAANPPLVFTDTDYTVKVVYCVQYIVQQAVTTMLTSLSNSMSGVVAIMFVFALVVFGMHILVGTQEARTRTPAFLLRLGIVFTFSYNLGGLAPYVFQIEQQLITLVSGGFSPWSQIDSFLGMLIGFAPCIVLAQGLLGIIAAALFSSTIGLAVFASGIMAVLEVILFLFDITYVYLTAILVIGFQLVISPLIVPLGIFFYTERYVTQWLNILIAAMLSPVLLFAFLSFFVGLLNVFITNILTVLGASCPPIPPNNLCNCTIDFHTFWRMDVPMFTWLMPADPNFNAELRNVNPGGVNMPAMPGAINPFLRLGVNINPAALPGLSFGSAVNDWSVQSQLIFSFASLWIFASMMKTITMRIPQVAESIAASISGVSMQPSPLTKLITGKKDDYEKFELSDYSKGHANRSER